MNPFDYDCMLKKRTARGAYHRKGGSKSKKCTLPSDYLTPKQLRELNGKVNTYYMNKPMDWKTFKSASQQIQVEYIDHLVSEYGVGKAGIAKMFGVSRTLVDQYFKSLPLKSQFKRGSHQTPEQKTLWAAFVGGVDVVTVDAQDTPEAVVEVAEAEFGAIDAAEVVESAAAEVAEKNCENVDAVIERCDVAAPEYPVEEPREEQHHCCRCGNHKVEQPKKMQMKKFSLVFEGRIDPDAIANSIRIIAGEDAIGTVEIKCEF